MVRHSHNNDRTTWLPLIAGAAEPGLGEALIRLARLAAAEHLAQLDAQADRDASPGSPGSAATAEADR